jgi:hypothetical protein
LFAPPILAAPIDVGNPDLKILWDNTVKYSTAVRVGSPSDTTTAPAFGFFANGDDGDRSIKQGGQISNRFDLLSEMDISYRGYGLRVSGAAWYDSIYWRGHTDNDSPSTYNPYSVGNNTFNAAAQRLHGLNAELLDAFVFGKSEIGNTNLTYRLGQHTVVWGETLFMGANGIAAAQAPIDIAKAASVPNTQFKELMRPVPQVSMQWQVNPELALSVYYQFAWVPNRFPAAGTYFSPVDFFAEGGERLLVGQPNGASNGNALALWRISDRKASSQGQGGVAVKYRYSDYDLGLYAVNYHEKSPQIYTMAGVNTNIGVGKVGQFQWVYPEDIHSVGVSANTTFGNYNIGFETSVRMNMPLDSDAADNSSGNGDNKDSPLYAVGNTYHANLNTLASLGPSFISREADFLAELGYNRLINVTKNRNILNLRATHDAANVRFVYEPKYRQVLPGLDLSVPVGTGYGFLGNSAMVGAFNGDGVGDFNIGINATYLDVWRAGLSYTHFYGDAANFWDVNGHRSYGQVQADRDFVAFNIRRTF